MARFLTIFAILAISGCCQTPVHPTIGMPPGPDLEPLPLTDEEWRELKPELKRVLNENGLEWELFFDRVKARIDLHDAR